jgi:hypothetical protein
VAQQAADGTFTMRAEATVTFTPSLRGIELQAAVAHEGAHVAGGQALAASFSKDLSHWDNALDLTGRQTETAAYRITAAVADLTNSTFKFDGGTFKPNMLAPAIDKQIDGILRSVYEPEYLNNTAFGWGQVSPP